MWRLTVVRSFVLLLPPSLSDSITVACRPSSSTPATAMRAVPLLLSVAVALLATSASCVSAQEPPPNIDFWSTPAPSVTFPARYDYTGVIDSMDRLFVIAGNVAQAPANDVWSLQPGDGYKDWSCQSCQAPAGAARFSPRFFAGTASIGGKYLAITSGTNSTNVFNDVSAIRSGARGVGSGGEAA